MIGSVQQLEEILSTPSEQDLSALKSMEGDLLILGAGGKMGPTLAMRAARAGKRTIAVSRWTDAEAKRRLQAAGVEVISTDLLDRKQLEALPDVENVLFMSGRKFGSATDPSLTWAMNVFLPGLIAERFSTSRIVAFSSGNVYPFMPLGEGGAREDTRMDPLGEYAQTGRGRERIFDYFSRTHGVRIALLRLNYAIDLRYGVLLDIGLKVFERKMVDVSMGAVNVIWQGDANSVALRAFPFATSPPTVLNLTGPETLSVRAIATRFGDHFGVKPQFTGAEGPTALLNDASRCHRIFGYPSVTPDEMIEWTARWIGMGGHTHNKPTGFQTRDGEF